MSLAKIFITGKVVKNPEKRFTQNDLPITDFTIDINPQDESLVRVVAIGNQAENISVHLQCAELLACFLLPWNHGSKSAFDGQLF